ncbi:C-type lectin domain family 7 member A isoform X2 [Talpa occidentalis]|uniref:C-type lectin domain family 7 member A isoform X2 n=1 Tax=Talpa occidentalis TaxID=50954 RepID=UPI0023F9DB35|nr:C-type lectin domain family 7 member A isoform X2 [Talpa occidentalis]
MDDQAQLGNLDEDGYTQLDFRSRSSARPVASKKGACAVSLPWRVIAVTLGILCLVIVVIAVVLGVTATWRSNSGNLPAESGQFPPRNKEKQQQPTQSSSEDSMPPTRTLPSTGFSNCPPEWIIYENSCYLLSTPLTSWNKSRNHCLLLGSNLLKIDSSGELQFIVEQVSSQPDQSFWIGLSRHQKDGPWLWEDGSTVSPSLFQVTSTETQENISHNCVWIHTSIFYDQLCNVSSHSICEKRLSKY